MNGSARLGICAKWKVYEFCPDLLVITAVITLGKTSLFVQDYQSLIHAPSSLKEVELHSVPSIPFFCLSDIASFQAKKLQGEENSKEE
jgi:hypothetical protein